MTDIKELLKEHIEKNSETRICYDIDRGEIDINGSRYRVGELSFNEVGGAVKSGSKRTLRGVQDNTVYLQLRSVREREVQGRSARTGI